MQGLESQFSSSTAYGKNVHSRHFLVFFLFCFFFFHFSTQEKKRERTRLQWKTEALLSRFSGVWEAVNSLRADWAYLQNWSKLTVYC